jgi:hypothetical protein
VCKSCLNTHPTDANWTTSTHLVRDQYTLMPLCRITTNSLLRAVCKWHSGPGLTLVMTSRLKSCSAVRRGTSCSSMKLWQSSSTDVRTLAHPTHIAGLSCIVESEGACIMRGVRHCTGLAAMTIVLHCAGGLLRVVLRTLRKARQPHAGACNRKLSAQSNNDGVACPAVDCRRRVLRAFPLGPSPL